MSVDKLEQMLGSYGPSPDGKPYTKVFDPEESPSGMIARSGKYEVISRVLDDDGEVYAGLYFQIKYTHIFLITTSSRVEMVFPTG
jgi:Rho GDP-dissociation inhibitor